MTNPETSTPSSLKPSGYKFVRNATFHFHRILGATGIMLSLGAGVQCWNTNKDKAEIKAALAEFADENGVPLDVLREAIETGPEDREEMAELIQSNRDRIEATEIMEKQLAEFANENGVPLDVLHEAIEMGPEDREEMAELIQSNRDRIEATELMEKQLAEFANNNDIPTYVLREAVKLSPEQRKDAADIIQSNREKIRAVEALGTQIPGGINSVERLLELPPQERDELMAFMDEYSSEEINSAAQAKSIVGAEKNPQKVKRILNTLGTNGINLSTLVEQNDFLKTGQRARASNAEALDTQFAASFERYLSHNFNAIINQLLEHRMHVFHLDITLDGARDASHFLGTTNCFENDIATYREYASIQRFYCTVSILPSGNIRFTARRATRGSGTGEYCSFSDTINIELPAAN